MIRIPRKFDRILATRLPGRSRFCPVCETAVRYFLPYRLPRAALMDALDCIGSDRKQFSCPNCGAHDRERHLLLYMRASGLLDFLRGKDLLHFAPEAGLQRWFAEADTRRYLRCDLVPQHPDVMCADITSMPFDDCTFDLVIANHVLEHVDCDRKATAEVKRVLRPGGYAILQTPYSPTLEATWEDAGIRTQEARLQAFGQEDHVRLFGRDIVSRVASCGLLPETSTHDALLPDVDPKRTGVNPREPFLLFRAPGLSPFIA